MAGAGPSFPSKYPDIYAYGKANALQVLPAASAPTYAANMAIAARGHDPRSTVHQTMRSVADDKLSARAHRLEGSRRKGAPHRRQNANVGGGYGTAQ